MTSFSPNPDQYNKSNFYEVLKLVTPSLYEEEDIALSGLGIDDIDQVINANILAASGLPAVMFVSGYEDLSSISQYFVKQNKLTYITPQIFEDKILSKLGTSFDAFKTPEEFRNYLSGNLLPKLKTSASNIHTLTQQAFGSTAGATQAYLANALGWFFFLNASGLPIPLTYSPSSYVLSQLSTLYTNNTLETADGVKGYINYLWRNYYTKTQISSRGLIPTQFLSGTGTYTSGIQQLEKLETLIDILYSKSYMDRQDLRIRNAFDDYINGLGLITTKKSKGPYEKFLKGISYSMADINNQIEQLETLYDIETCPEDYLKYLAHLLGWKLLGPDPVKWRHQLRSAVDIYKKKGTRAGVQLALNTVIKDTYLDASSTLYESWESYLPFLLWYCLATESIHFKNFTTWTLEKANQVGIAVYDENNFENNIKIAVDYILLEAVRRFPDLFYYQSKPFPAYKYVKLDNATGEQSQFFSFVTDPSPKSVFFEPNFSLAYALTNPNGFKENLAFTNSFHLGPSGTGLYLDYNFDPLSPSAFTADNRPTYLTTVGESSFVFNFRSYSNFPIPPFEEIKYYRDCDINNDLKIFLVEKLKCLGVNDSFANQFGNYISSATYKSTDDFSFRNNFLMFFSSIQNPPNYFSVLQNPDALDKDIFNLWNGKSSHVFLNLATSSFSFTSKEYAGNSAYALQATRDSINRFLPAHAIPALTLQISSVNDYLTTSSTKFDFVGLNQQQTTYSLPSGVFAGREISGLSMGTVSPGTDTGRGGLNTFARTDYDSYRDSLFSSTSYISNVPRKSIRRRGSKYTLPTTTYYDRTGFNQPITFDASVLEKSMPSSIGFLPLGYIPSSNSFYPVYNALVPSSVWDKCNELTSDNVYFDVSVSNTFPCRGLSSLGSDAKYFNVFGSAHDKYIDRGQTDPLFTIMQKAKYEEALNKARKTISLDLSSYIASSSYIDSETSLANSYHNNGVVSINSFSDYENFRFGKGLHQLFKDYKTYFNNTLALQYTEKTGANIFSHTFGPILYNADFSIEGSAVSTQEGRYIASSIDTIVPISYNGGSGVFSMSAVNNAFASGTYVASTVDKMPLPSGTSFYNEYRNPHILSGIEFVQPSAASINNSFEIIRLNQNLFSASPTSYASDKPFVRCFTVNGFPRIRFDLSSYGETRNLFIKDHKFKLTLKGQIADLRYEEYGGGRVGVWIHTGIVRGSDGINYFWSWTPKNKWELINYDSLDVQTIKEVLSFNFKFKDPARPVSETGTQLTCIGNEVIPFDSSAVSNKDPLVNITEDYLQTFSLEFNTFNFTNYNNSEYLEVIPIPDVYHASKATVHDINTNYIVEVFYYPADNENKYLLIDSISIQDLTLKYNSGIDTGYGIEVSGIPLTTFSEIYKYYPDKTELRNILKFFNNLTTNIYSTRNASISVSALDTSGGSRLNYRLHPDLISTKAATLQISGMDFTN